VALGSADYAADAAMALASCAAGDSYCSKAMSDLAGKNQAVAEDQKQTVSALASVSAGIAGGIAGGNTAGAAAGASAGKNAVENNFLSVSDKTELEIAKQKLNSKDPAERDKAQKTINDLREKDIASDQKVIDACGNGNAGSAACAGARLEVIAA